MSYATITQATQDRALIDRVAAALAQEAWQNPPATGQEYAERVKAGPVGATQEVIWPISADNAAAYEYALNSGNPNPGGDPSVITDAALLSGVQTYWPQDSP